MVFFETFSSRDLFYPILLISVAVHLLGITVTRLPMERSEFSVERAPNTISISIIKAAPVKKPVVKEKKVETPVVEETKVITTPSKTVNEVVVPDPMIEEKVEPVKEVTEEIVENIEPLVEVEQIVKNTLVSDESLGAVTEAEPLGRVNPAPRYPGIARRRGWQGTVRLKVWINIQGLVDQIKIEESSGYDALDQSALKAVKSWQFKPAERNQKRVSSQILLPIEFRLTNS